MRPFLNGQSSRFGWGASAGVFGAGPGADFTGSPGKPFFIAQIEISPKESDGETAGTYRLYGWSNAQAEQFDQARGRHSG